MMNKNLFIKNFYFDSKSNEKVSQQIDFIDESNKMGHFVMQNICFLVFFSLSEKSAVLKTKKKVQYKKLNSTYK